MALSPQDHYIAKPPVSADLSKLLERLAESDDTSSDSSGPMPE
jgi:hypothetical protein